MFKRTNKTIKWTFLIPIISTIIDLSKKKNKKLNLSKQCMVILHAKI